MSAGPTVETSSADETGALAAGLADLLDPGDVVELVGELGAGKTTFVRAAAAALGVTEAVTSPSFSIAQRYRGRMPIVHLDGYRLAGGDAEDTELFAGEVDDDAVVFVEWPDNLRDALPAPRVRVTIEHLGGDRRLVRFEPAEPATLAAVRRLVADTRPRYLHGQSEPGPHGRH